MGVFKWLIMTSVYNRLASACQVCRNRKKQTKIQVKDEIKMCMNETDGKDRGSIKTILKTKNLINTQSRTKMNLLNGLVTAHFITSIQNKQLDAVARFQE